MSTATDGHSLASVPDARDGYDEVREQAWVFAEEFARTGYDAPRILLLFQNAVAHPEANRVYRHLGHASMLDIIARCVGMWGERSIVTASSDCYPLRRGEL